MAAEVPSFGQSWSCSTAKQPDRGHHDLTLRHTWLSALGSNSTKGPMPRFLISRALGDVGEDELEAAADISRRVRAEQFPEIEWEHSHVVRTRRGPDFLLCLCSPPRTAHPRPRRRRRASCRRRARDRARSAALITFVHVANGQRSIDFY